MNIVLITVGGSGTRMGYCVPKQFANVLGKLLIVHTLEEFEHHAGVDAIAVVRLKGWENQLREMSVRYRITKLKHTVPGGATNQESIRCGVEVLALHYEKDGVVLIHDAVPPMLSEEMISDCLRMVREKGKCLGQSAVFGTAFDSGRQGQLSRSTLTRRLDEKPRRRKVSRWGNWQRRTARLRSGKSRNAWRFVN